MSTEPLVLAVDDEPGILRLIKLELSTQGFRVVTAANGPDGLKTAEEQRPDIALLDIVMPEMSGLEVMRKLRERSSIPVILLTAKGSESDKVKGLELGADDYLAKPFSPRTLLARVRALLRRAGVDAPAELAAGDLSLDLEQHQVRVRGAEPTRLTPLEARLLQLLLANARRTLPADRLLAHVWGHRNDGDRQLLKQLVHRLRRKIESDPAAPRYLLTESGVGYRLEPGAE